jgi:hypothetical protein
MPYELFANLNGNGRCIRYTGTDTDVGSSFAQRQPWGGSYASAVHLCQRTLQNVFPTFIDGIHGFTRGQVASQVLVGIHVQPQLGFPKLSRSLSRDVR